MGSSVIPFRRRTEMWEWGGAASNGCGHGRNARLGVVFFKVFFLLSVQGSEKLRLCSTAVTVGHERCNIVRFGVAYGLRVMWGRVGLSSLFLGVQSIAIKSLTPKFSVIYVYRSAARFARAKSWGGDPDGDRLRGACAVVGEQGRVLRAVSLR